MKAAVFDTGEHGVGGRAATRTTTDPSVHADWLSKDSSGALKAAGLTFDHAAQCFTATDPAFQQQCEAWLAAGVAKRWQGPVGTLKPGGVFTPLDSGVPVYVATGGMRQLAESMAEEVREARLVVDYPVVCRLGGVVGMLCSSVWPSCGLRVCACLGSSWNLGAVHLMQGRTGTAALWP